MNKNSITPEAIGNLISHCTKGDKGIEAIVGAWLSDLFGIQVDVDCAVCSGDYILYINISSGDTNELITKSIVNAAMQIKDCLGKWLFSFIIVNYMDQMIVRRYPDTGEHTKTNENHSE